MKKLFLDDFRDPYDCVNYMYARTTESHLYGESDWIVVRDAKEFEEYINTNGLPDLISFDHDLALDHYAPAEDVDYNQWLLEQHSKEKTGYDCAKFLANYCIEHKLLLPKYLVHSMNPVGTENINKYLGSFVNFQTKN